MRLYFCLLGVLILSLPLIAQQEYSELERQLDTAQGIARIQILNELSMHYNHKLRRYKPKEAMEKARAALQLAKAMDYKDGQAVAYYRMGNVYAGQKDEHQQMAHYEKWLQVRKVQGDPMKIGWALNQLVFLYSSSGNETELLRHYEDVKQIYQRHNRPLLAYSAALRVAAFYMDRNDLKEWFRYQREAIHFLQNSKITDSYISISGYLKSRAELLSMLIRDIPEINSITAEAKEADIDYLKRRAAYGILLLEECGFEEITQTTVRLLTLEAIKDSIPSLVDPYADRWLATELAKENWLEVGKVYRTWALFEQERGQYEAALEHFYKAYQNSVKVEETERLQRRHSRWSVVAVKGIVNLLSSEPEQLDKRSHRRVLRLLKKWVADVEQAAYAPDLAIALLPLLLKQQKELLERL